MTMGTRAPGALSRLLAVLALLFAIVLRPLNPERTCALFLVVYCISASYTESGLGDASPYLLDPAVATSLVAAAGPRRATTARSREEADVGPAPPTPDRSDNSQMDYQGDLRA